MHTRIAVIVAAGLMLAGQTAYAAESARLTAVTGTVMVSQNGRFAPARSGAALRAGDRIVSTSGSARVVYGDGCSVAVSARSMMTIGGASPCVGGSSGVVRVSSPGGEDGYEESNSADSWECSGSLGCGPTKKVGGIPTGDFGLWLAFGVVAVATTAAALNDDSNPNSP